MRFKKLAGISCEVSGRNTLDSQGNSLLTRTVRRVVERLPGRLASLRKPGLAEIVCVTLALSCVVLPEWWALERNRAQRQKELRVSLRAAADNTKQLIRTQVRVAMLKTIGVAASPAAAELAESSENSLNRLHAELLEDLRPSIGEDFGEGWLPSAYALLPAQGAAVVYPAGATLPQDLSSLDEVRAAWKGTPSVLPIARMRSGTDSEWVLSAIAPLQVSRGPVNGVLVAYFEAQKPLRQILEGGGRSWLFTSHDTWLAGPTAEGKDPAIPCRVTPSQLLAAASGEHAAVGAATSQERTSYNVLGYEGCEGRAAVGAWDAVPELGLGLLTEIDAKEAFRTVESARAAVLVIALVLGVALLFLVLLQTSPEAPEGRRVEKPRKNSAAWGILAVSLLTTALAWLTAQSKFDGYERSRFKQEAAHLRDSMAERIGQYSQALLAARGAHAALGAEREPEWAAFIRSLNLSDALPAVSSVALIEESEGAPARPEFDARATEPPEAMPRYEAARLERFEPFLQAARRAKAERSWIVSRSPADSVEGDGDTYLLMLAPLYPRPAGRFYGWAVAELRVDELMRNLGGSESGRLDFELYEADDSGNGELVYDSDAIVQSGVGGQGEGGAYSLPLEFGGRRFQLSFAPASAFVAPLAQNYPAQVLLGGLAISVLLFDIALVLSSTRARAIGIAELMSSRYRESAARVRAVIENAPDGILTFDGQGGIETFNSGAERLFGATLDQVLGSPVEGLLPVVKPSHVDRLADERTEVIECDAQSFDGRRFPSELRISRMELDGRTLYAAIVRDVSARKEAAAALQESEQRYALAARGANDGLWDWDLQRRRIYYSMRWKAMLGLTDEEVGDHPEEWFGRVHPDDLHRLHAKLEDHLEGRTAHFESEHRMRHTHGGYSWVLNRGIAVRDENGKAMRLAGSQTDITERKRAEKQLIHDALHDPLTGLPNRVYFMTQVRRAVEAASKSNENVFALLFLDVDRFKVVNDSLGHFIGDQLLVALSERLKACVRPGDAICRLGGDEFAVLVNRLRFPEDATRIAERIQRDLEEPVHIGTREVFATVSIGITMSAGVPREPEELLRDADTAMYRAKAGGRARYELFDRKTHPGTVDVLQLETDMRHSVERNELRVMYQPIVSLSDKRVVGCEALMRWEHPERGLIPPNEFIPLAEETGLINAMSDWLIREACRQIKEWADAGLPLLTLSANISPRQLGDKNLSRTVMEALASARLDPEYLQLELTETALTESSPPAIQPLIELKERGVRIALDDFGTGYSSLIHLRRFPISTIKIDQSFVKNVPRDPGNSAIAAGLIALAHNLNLSVVVEGVEKAEQLAFFVEKHCDEAQGYAISRPLDADGFKDFMQHRWNPSSRLLTSAAGV